MINFVNIGLSKKKLCVIEILQIGVEDLFRHGIIELLPAVMCLLEESRHGDSDLPRVSRTLFELADAAIGGAQDR